jgi:hypothetical protein
MLIVDEIGEAVRTFSIQKGQIVGKKQIGNIKMDFKKTRYENANCIRMALDRNPTWLLLRK